MTLNCENHSAGDVNHLFSVLFKSLLMSQCAITPDSMWPEDYGPTALEKGLDTYDFIVIGAGSAGSIVASRLSENPKWKILLLEAGDNPTSENEIPAILFSDQLTEYDWNFHPERPLNACRNLVDGCRCSQGKLLGGSHGINTMLYIRGNEQDYNNWQELGNENWFYESVLEYFKKSEGNKNCSKARDKEHHNHKGELLIDEYLNELEQNPIVNTIMDAWKELGLKRLDDLNADKWIGYGYAQGTIHKGRRQTTAKNYLIPASKRPNLHIIKHAQVTKVLFRANKAFGIKFIYKKQYNMTARTQKEIILSAGTISSPTLLMLSGIGPKEHLKKFNIPIVSNLPVGKNLVDHVCVHMFFELNSNNLKHIAKEIGSLDSIYEYAVHQTGPYSHLGIANFQTFFHTKNDSKYPDVQVNHVFYKQNSSVLAFEAAQFKEPSKSYLIQKNTNSDILLIRVILLNPKSVGKIELSDTNPYGKPKIYLNYLDHSDDMNTMIRGVKNVLKMISTKSFRDKQAKFIYLPANECEALSINSDDYLRCYIRSYSKSVYHYTSTSRMGPDFDENSVVDPRLKVKGVNGLRQIDAGIMPYIVSANINAAVIMIAEKGADLVKEDWIEQMKYSVDSIGLRSLGAIL